MKTRIMTPQRRLGTQIIARFGRARLIEHWDGRAELHDATPAEQTEAKEWISLFRHQTVLHLSR